MSDDPRINGTDKTATTIGDSECIVKVAVEKPGTDEHHVEATFEDKVTPTKKT